MSKIKKYVELILDEEAKALKEVSNIEKHLKAIYTEIHNRLVEIGTKAKRQDFLNITGDIEELIRDLKDIQKSPYVQDKTRFEHFLDNLNNYTSFYRAGQRDFFESKEKEFSQFITAMTNSFELLVGDELKKRYKLAEDIKSRIERFGQH